MGEIRKRGRVWWIRYCRDGRRYEESSGSTKKGVASELLKIREGDGAHGLPVTPQMGRVRFEDAATDLLNDYIVNGRKTYADVKRRIDKHLTPYFRGRRMASITTADVRAYITERLAARVIVRAAHTVAHKDGTWRQVREHRRDVKSVSNGEINRELTILKRMFTLAVEGKKLYAIPHIPMLKEDNVRRGFFEPDQFERVQAHLSPHLRNVAAVAYITGWRARSEVLPLEWRQVDFAAGEIRLDAGTTKNGEARTFPLTIELRRVLEDQQREAERLKREAGVIPRFVFTKKNGARIGSFRKAWAAACAAAGCPGRIVHDCRRTAVRTLVRAGISEGVAMTMTGHKTRSVFERYNIVSQADLKEAASKLDSAGVGQKRDNAGFPALVRPSR